VTGQENVPTGATQLALLMCDLVESTRIVQQIGDEKAARLFAHHDRLARDLLARYGGKEIDKTDGFLLVFTETADAVRFAMAYHLGLEELSREARTRIAARTGIHVGAVFIRENPPEDVRRGAKPLEIEGLAKPLTARLMSLAGPGQTLLSREAFDEARNDPALGRFEHHPVSWLACGPYRLKGIDGEIEVFEVGIEGHAPLRPPGPSEKSRPLGSGDAILGWRPAAGQVVPNREAWHLQRKLGEGGFGEVWLALDPSTGATRVFKFCFDAGRLRALRREVALFRILRDALGRREDIARILDWHLKEPPFFLEMEYTQGGDLAAWLESMGGAQAVPRKLRLEIAAGIAEALAAAHSVGVLHKDVKPSNVLVFEDAQGTPRVRLTDFGVGALADPARLEELHLTGLGVTDLSSGSSDTAGSLVYMAPELFEGASPSSRTDVYSLGVLTYQLAAGNLRRPMAPGWEAGVEDEILREDISSMVSGDPAARPGDATEASGRLRNLEARREQREKETAAQEAARKAAKELARAHRRRRFLAMASGLLLIFTISVGWQAWRAAREAKRAERSAASAREVSQFLVDLFKIADPTSGKGTTVTARELLDQGARELEQRLGGQPLTRARMEDTLGQVYLRLGLLQRAERLLGAAAATRAQALGQDAPEYLESRRHLAELWTRQGRYAEAGATLHELLRAEEVARPPDHEALRQTLAALIQLSTAQGNFDAVHDLDRRLHKLEAAAPVRGSSKEVNESIQPRPQRSRSPLELVAAIPFPGDATWATALDPDRNVLLVASPESLSRVDMNGITPPEPISLAPGEMPAGALADGRLLLRTPRGLIFRSYDFTARERKDVPTGIVAGTSDLVSVSTDGATIAVVSRGRASVYRTGPGKAHLLSSFQIPPLRSAKLMKVAFRHMVAIVEESDGIALMSWDVRNGTTLFRRSKTWHGRALCLALDETSGSIAVGGWFDEVLLYHLKDGSPAEQLSLPGATYGLGFWPDYPSLAIAKVGRVAIWRRGQGVVAVHDDPAGRFFLAGRGPAGILIADRRTFRLLELRYHSLRLKRSLPVASHAIWAVVGTPDERRVFAASEDGSIPAYDLDRDKLRTIRAHSQGVTALLARDGYLASASDDRTVAVFDARTLEELHRARGHEHLVNALDLDPSGSLWSSSSDHTLRSWSWPDLRPRLTVPLGASAAGLWMRKDRGLGIVGAWGGSWMALRFEAGKWKVKRRYPWGSHGLYRIVELPGARLLALQGTQPPRLAFLDPGAMSMAELPLPPGMQEWIERYTDRELVVFGDDMLGLLHVERAGKEIRVVERWGVPDRAGVLGGGTVLPGRRLIVAGTARGRLLFVSLNALQSLPASPGRVLELHEP